jgi:hypothetical protein
MITYEEKIPTYSVVIWVGVLSVIMFAAIIIAPFFGKLIQFTPVIRAVMVSVILLDIILLMTFSSLKITVADGMLSFGFGKLRRKFPLEKIESAEPSEYSFLNYFGYGIRYGLDHTQGYIPRGGKGIILKIKGERLKYFISTSEPEALIAALRLKTK